MRALKRLAKPQILVDKEKEWTDSFLNSGKNRPDSNKYGNAAIKRELNSMSFNKCFYCEAKLTDRPKEIDHHIEVSVDKNLSYQWENLYLSCDNCNDKIPHSEIAITDALDPCVHSDEEIKRNITFDRESITAKNGSKLGLITIQKYRLDSDLLDKRRLKQLDLFSQILDAIRKKQIADGGRTWNEKEREKINLFKQKDQPYSLMFEIIIDKIDQVQ
jgi:uncharacterized protein (TIGR02646 family)